jgi:predicted nucleic acid-binding protein
MNLVDSSGWLEYFADGKNGAFFAPPIQDVSRLIVPTLCIFEVFKRVLQQAGQASALQASALMHQGAVVDLSSSIAMAAAQLSVARKLPMADSIILATSQKYRATLWTQDADFEGFPGVKFAKKRER